MITERVTKLIKVAIQLLFEGNLYHKYNFPNE